MFGGPQTKCKNLHQSATCKYITSYLTIEIRQFLQIETNMTNKVTCTETIFYFISVKQTKRIYCVEKKPKYYPLKKLLIIRKSKICQTQNCHIFFFKMLTWKELIILSTYSHTISVLSSMQSGIVTDIT